MDFKEYPGAEHPYGVTFTPDEVEIVAAAFREHVYELAVKGNSGSISHFDAALAGWEQTKNGHEALLYSPKDLIKVLDSFHERTGDTIMNMPDDISIPAFANPYISKRHLLGEKALELANQIKNEHAVSEFNRELDGDASALSEESLED